MQSGKTLWEEICLHYEAGVLGVHEMQKTWDSMEDRVDGVQFKHVQTLVNIQAKEARWWRDACILYFQSYSKPPIPNGLEASLHDLDYYMNLSSQCAPY